ncbi:MAG: c-type cytochrome domain-containing protein, partial [Pirellula sp.]
MIFSTRIYAQSVEPSTSIDFGLQIRPILSEHCFHCHGPDEAHRQADLRLDQEDSAKRVRDGKQAIHAGAIALSQIIERIESDDPDLVMPPPSARKTVTPEQRELLKRWIEQGAQWGSHWAFELPKRSPLPLFEDIDPKKAAWGNS